MVIVHLVPIHGLHLYLSGIHGFTSQSVHVITVAIEPSAATVAWLLEILEISTTVGFGTLSYIHIHIHTYTYIIDISK
jgi:hypothetical protein